MRIAGLVRVLLGTMLLAASLAARAEFAFDAKLGWDGRVRNGRWNPVLVQLQNTTPVSVDVELYTPRDSSQAVMTRIGATAGPVAQTYVLYAPLAVGVDAITLRVVDTASRKTLGEAKLVDPDRISSYGNGSYSNGNYGDLLVYQNGLFVGVSGVEPVLKELGAPINSSDSRETVGYLRPAALPQAAKGFDAVDVLVLNQPDLNTLETAQKKAILDWVRAGGRLLVWFGAGPLPPDDPFVRALPCKVGDNTTLELSQQDVSRAGLPDRFTKMGGRVLVPAAGAGVMDVLGGGGAKAVFTRYGFGEIAVLSFDGSALFFRDNGDAHKFWDSLLQLGSPHPDNLYYRHTSQQTEENAQATTQVMDLLGNVPGVGTFGFGYVATTLIALMLIVGPIDWLVLKWLGRQPWTWVTTTGWIGLVTVAAIYIGHLLRSGDLHLRTLRVVDQADGVVVARNDFVGIYSPRTADYELEPPPDSWWEPLSGERYYYSSDRVVNVLNCRQSLRETVPDPRNPMTIPVWNLRFLRGETIEKGEPLIEASLRILPDPTGSSNRPDLYPRVVGTITNRSDMAMTQLKIRVRGCNINVSDPSGRAPADKTAAGIPPHGTVSIDLPLRYDRGFVDAELGNPGRYITPTPGQELALPPYQIQGLVEGLTPDRTRRVNEILPERYANPTPDKDEMACVYALIENAPAAAPLKGWQPIEKNWVAVRALVKLAQPGGN